MRHRYILHILFFVSLFSFLVNSPLQAQQRRITTNDEANIKRKALTLLNSLVDKYNQILESDSDERKIVIDNMILPSDVGFSTFVDDQVTIEDDFSTQANLPQNERDKKVGVYFQNIGAYFGVADNGEFQNKDKKIIFSNLSTSKIMRQSPNDSMYIKVNFEIKYDGIDSRTQKPFSQPCSRVAELQIHRVKSVWQVAIRSIYFYDRNKDEDYSNNVFVEKVASTIENTKDIDVSPESIITEKKIVCKNPIIQAFKQGDQWGLRDVVTDKVIVQPSYAEIDNFTDDRLALVNIDGYWGYIDVQGAISIKCEFDNAEPFSKEKKGKAKVQKGMESYFIDTLGNKTK